SLSSQRTQPASQLTRPDGPPSEGVHPHHGGGPGSRQVAGRHGTELQGPGELEQATTETGGRSGAEDERARRAFSAPDTGAEGGTRPAPGAVPGGPSTAERGLGGWPALSDAGIPRSSDRGLLLHGPAPGDGPGGRRAEPPAKRKTG